MIFFVYDVLKEKSKDKHLAQCLSYITFICTAVRLFSTRFCSVGIFLTLTNILTLINGEIVQKIEQNDSGCIKSCVRTRLTLTSNLNQLLLSLSQSHYTKYSGMIFLTVQVF